MKNDRVLPYVIVVGIVAIVAIVTLFLCSGGIQGAVLGYSYGEEEQFPCLDEDSANDYYVSGKLHHGKIIYEDYCVDGQLYQHYCPISNTVRLLAPYTCPHGCFNGACVAE